MRSFLIAVAVIAAVYAWKFFRPPEVVDHYAQYFDGIDQDVIMYATKSCGYCKRMRTWFAENSIRYFEYDITVSDTGRRQFRELGGHGVPLILVRDKLIRGYNPRAVRKALQQLAPQAEPAAMPSG